MTKALSIIIPVYNGEKYIDACLNALVPQIDENSELVLINDGSTDRTDELIRNGYAKQITSGLIQYHVIPNGGVSAARNLGLARAVGQYIAFVDADDAVSHDYVRCVIDAMSALPCIIEIGHRTTDQYGNVLDGGRHLHKKFGTHRTSEVIDDVFAACNWYPFLRITKRDTLTGINFQEGVKYCEDVIFFSQVYKASRKITSVPAFLYDYRINPEGATRNIKATDSQPLIDFYRSIILDRSSSNSFLKITLAYAIRRCTAPKNSSFGKLPSDIGFDVLRSTLSSRALLKINRHFVLGATAGFLFSRLKGIFK
jgi:glycosyltransferase involved in cell wall biosynthesis